MIRAALLAFAGCLAFVSGSAHAALNNFGQVVPGAIYRGAQPDVPADLADLKAHGVRTILDLRDDETVPSEAQAAQQLGLGFINAPMHSGRYPDEAVVARALKVLEDRSLLPVYVHCQHGEARTGLVIGLFRVDFMHWTRSQAFQEMTQYGFNRWHFELYKFFLDHTPTGLLPY